MLKKEPDLHTYCDKHTILKFQVSVGTREPVLPSRSPHGASGVEAGDPRRHVRPSVPRLWLRGRRCGRQMRWLQKSRLLPPVAPSGRLETAAQTRVQEGRL